MMDSIDVERLIGHGRFGEVYLVRSETSGERYVLKKIRISSACHSPPSLQQDILLSLGPGLQSKIHVEIYIH